MRSSNVRKLHDIFTDNWLTPLDLVEVLGPFDLDPCCPKMMPWRTARQMVCLPNDGLTVKWHGRVWCNPPYSNPLAWVEKMVDHANGIMLIPGKSPDTKWCQLAYTSATAVLFLRGRILFYTEKGDKSKGKWMPNVLVAFGEFNAMMLKNLPFDSEYRGVYFKRIE